MANGKSALDGDGVRTTRTGGPRREVIAVVVLAAGLVAGRALLHSGETPASEPAARATSSSTPNLGSSAAGAAAVHAAPAGPAAPVAGNASSSTRNVAGEEAADPVTLPKSRGAQLRALRKLGIKPTRGPDGNPRLDAAPVIEALNAAGIHEGIAAFPPPGTDPPKPGIIVPETFELPEGYVRHHQVTDDGEALPPILMFHPDYEFVGEDGVPLVLPDDRVVPPELAPPGMPIELLEIPERGRSR